MRIGIVQHDIVWADAEANLATVGALIDGMPAADLYVLPEMFSTGFVTEPDKCPSLPADSQRALAWMKERAMSMGKALAGSIATPTDNTHWANRLSVALPDGTVTAYDKRHLFAYGGEDRCYAQGQQRVVANVGGVRMLLLVCYDLRFPVWSRCRGDYDAIVYVANWPESRIGAWNTLLRARAIENQCYVVGVNRVGDDPQCHYCGASAIIGPKGETLAACNDEGRTETALTDIDLAALQRFREHFPVLRDADGFKTEQ